MCYINAYPFGIILSLYIVQEYCKRSEGWGRDPHPSWGGSCSFSMQMKAIILVNRRLDCSPDLPSPCLYQLTLPLHLQPFSFFFFFASYSGIKHTCQWPDNHIAMLVKFRDNCEPQWGVYDTLRTCLFNTCEQDWLSPLAFVQCLWSNAISYNDAKTTARFLLLTSDFSWAEFFNSSAY